MKVNRLVLDRQSEYLKDETFLFIDTIMPSYENGDMQSIQAFAEKFNYQIVPQVPEKIDVIYHKENKDIKVKIFENKRYTGALIYYHNNSLIVIKNNYLSFWDKYGLQLFILPVFLILTLLVGIFFSALNTLSKIRDGVEEVARGNHDFEIQNDRQDEIGDLVETFKKAKDIIAKILKGRELILRSLGHELKTPLAKMKLFLALKEPKNEDDIKMQKYVNELQKISENILELERINSGNLILEQNNFLSETLLLEALNGFEDEQEKIIFNIKENYLIKNDLRLLVVVIKNLIDNGLKYAADGKIYIECYKHLLTFKNKGEPLKYDISYYLEPFYRDDRHHAILGHGLGLSIISEIIKILKLSFEYKYQDGYHHFIVNLQSKEW